MAGEEHYSGKEQISQTPHAMHNARAINANKTTLRLNLHIRRSYACPQLISLRFTEVPLTASGFFIIENLDTAIKTCEQKQIYMTMLKMQLMYATRPMLPNATRTNEIIDTHFRR
jgi:hypothetical protein